MGWLDKPLTKHVLINSVLYQHSPLRAHSTVQSQQPPVTSSLSCICCLQLMYVKISRIIGDIFEPGGAQLPGVFSGTLMGVQRVFGSYLDPCPYEPRADAVRDFMT